MADELPPPLDLTAVHLPHTTLREITPVNTIDKNGERRMKRRFVQSVSLLRLPQNQWCNAVMEAVGDFAARMTPQMTASVLLWSAFLILEDTKKDTERVRRLLEADEKETDIKKRLDVEYKIHLEGQLTKYLHEYAALLEQTMKLSERAQTKEKGKGALRNLPPSLPGTMEFNAPVQLNIGQQPPAEAANNGSDTEMPTPDAAA